MAQDLDQMEPDVSVNDLEGRARRTMEHQRSSYYNHSRAMRDATPGGRYYKTLLDAYGPKSAEANYNVCKVNYEQYLASVMLNENGETTNPAYPTDRMIARERRRLRSTIFVNTDHFIHCLDEYLPNDVRSWDLGTLLFYFANFPQRHYDAFYEQIMDMHLVCTTGVKSPKEVDDHLHELAIEVIRMIIRIPDSVLILIGNSVTDNRDDQHDRSQIMQHIRMSLIDFLLGELPYANPVLAIKEDLAPNTIGKETVEEEKPVLH